MRTYTSNNITVTYQESVVWLGDSNIITVESMDVNDKVGAEIIIRHPAGTETRTIRHLSDLNKLLFVIDDALAALIDDNIGQYTIQIDVYKNGAYSFTRSFSFQLLKGKSFTNQSHAIGRTIYIYSLDELYKLQIYSPANGVFSAGGQTFNLVKGLNQFNLTNDIDGDGTYGYCLQNSQISPIAVITGAIAKTPYKSQIQYGLVRAAYTEDVTEKGGDVWRYDDEIFPVCGDIIFEEPCWNNDFVELRYTDTDGCVRYLGGKLASETNSVNGTNYYRAEGTNVFRNIPRSHRETTKRSIKVGFMDVKTDAYPQDILYSDEVFMKMYNGEWWPVIIGTEKIEIKSGDTQDIELEVIISEE